MTVVDFSVYLERGKRGDFIVKSALKKSAPRGQSRSLNFDRLSS